MLQYDRHDTRRRRIGNKLGQAFAVPQVAALRRCQRYEIERMQFVQIAKQSRAVSRLKFRVLAFVNERRARRVPGNVPRVTVQ
jgi:hypothetical protein